MAVMAVMDVEQRDDVHSTFRRGVKEGVRKLDKMVGLFDALAISVVDEAVVERPLALFEDDVIPDLRKKDVAGLPVIIDLTEQRVSGLILF